MCLLDGHFYCFEQALHVFKRWSQIWAKVFLRECPNRLASWFDITHRRCRISETCWGGFWADVHQAIADGANAPWHPRNYSALLGKSWGSQRFFGLVYNSNYMMSTNLKYKNLLRPILKEWYKLRKRPFRTMSFLFLVWSPFFLLPAFSKTLLTEAWANGLPEQSSDVSAARRALRHPQEASSCGLSCTGHARWQGLKGQTGCLTLSLKLPATSSYAKSFLSCPSCHTGSYGERSSFVVPRQDEIVPYSQAVQCHDALKTSKKKLQCWVGRTGCDDARVFVAAGVVRWFRTKNICERNIIYRND